MARSSLRGRSLVVCVLTGALGGLMASLPGCSSGPDKVDYARAFPREVPRAKTLDIQVFREGKEIEFTNTTGAAYPACTMWLNARFSKPIPGLAVGETLKLSLRDFRDEYSDAYRAGGFFATEKPDRLVLAQLEVPGPDGSPVMYGLVVVGTGSEE